ncbi:MAG: hypothetical protein JWN17_1698 [Frankiales bacterium]|nr:hypothetical protein [Frankiales bacterium]
MRRALATAALVGGVVLTPLAAPPAQAAVPHTAPVLVTSSGTNVDEPGNNGSDDDSGRWGLAGLLGMLGLFGYKKYKDHRAATTGAGQQVGTVDTDGTGSRRL